MSSDDCIMINNNMFITIHSPWFYFLLAPFDDSIAQALSITFLTFVSHHATFLSWPTVCTPGEVANHRLVLLFAREGLLVCEDLLTTGQVVDGDPITLVGADDVGRVLPEDGGGRRGLPACR